MPTHRHERVRELLKREIGEAIRREIPIDQAGLITVNDVGLAGDLKSTLIYVSILGGSEQQRTGYALLQKNRLRLQDLVAKSVVLKYAPRLRFALDDSVARGNKVLQILDELERQSLPQQ